MEPYAATKFAVVAMSEGWHAQLAPKGIGVSVLCPGFVRTDLGTGHRNRPGGPRPSADRERDARLKQLIDGGMDAKMVAARVLEAIRGNELYVFTHPELKSAVEGRFNAILAAFDEAAKSPALAGHAPQDLTALGVPTAANG
jgi:short-subunit dehydrogenase